MKQLDYNANLNKAQFEAVSSPDGPTLVIAGAGSGKTRTLVFRVAWLVERGILPEKILLLTFTRKASQEMLRRVEEMLGKSCQGVAGGTFHSLAYKLLRRYGTRIGLPAPLSVIDRKDSEETVAKLIKSKGLDSLKDFPSKKEFLELLGRVTNRGQTFEDGVSHFFPEGTPYLSKLKELNQGYENFKQGHGLLDYDDLLKHCLRIFQQEPGLAEKISSFYQYVLVDEYQDTNLLQSEMVRYLARAHGNIMVVGDDSQSIYGFRGAHFKNILDFPSLFPGTRVIKLEENFRSCQPILNLANKVISFSRQRYSKCLFSRFSQGEPPLCLELPYEESQSLYVVSQLEEFRKQGIPWNEMAVLFRAGHHSFNLEIFLQKQSIPFVKFGGRRLIEGAHIKDLLAYLKVVMNPKDILAWERILQLLEGLGPKRAQEITGQLNACPDWPAKIRFLREYPRLKPQIEKLGALFQGLVDRPVSPSEALEIIWEYYKNILPRLFEEDHGRRQKEIEEVIRVSYAYPDIDLFLGDLTLEAYDGKGDIQEDRLILSTVHSAKGLEWRVVFIIWVSEGRFPSIHAQEDPDELEEERRLLYVAITRAKERLFLTYPQTNSQRGGGWQRNELCHFLAGIPEEILPRRGKPAQTSAGSGFAPQAVDDDGYPKGTRVFHSLFGNGVVQEPPKERKVKVLFKRYGSKVLHLDYAKLEKEDARDDLPF